MNFIFPMGGLSQRFTDAGYTVPKYMLDLHGFSVFEHAVIGFERYFAVHNFVFALRKDPEAEAFVRGKCRALGIPDKNLQIVTLDGPTSGQAETVWIAIQQAALPADDPVVIFNIDSFQSDFILPETIDLEHIAGYLEVFIGAGDHWSFVLPGPDFSAQMVTEKQRISELCSSGLYHFRRAGDFAAAFEQTLDMQLSELQGGERYVAPLYNALIAKGLPVKYHLVLASDVTFCGTPDEYTLLLGQDAPPTTKALKRRAKG